MSIAGEAPGERCDLMVRAGRVVDPGTDRDGPGWVAVTHGRITGTGTQSETPPESANSLSFPDGILLPGLIDLHAHPALSGSRYGIDPDEHMLARGSTTVLSQGDAGARTWDRYRAETIAGRKTRIRMALHLSRNGEANPDGPFTEIAFADVEECAGAISGDDSGAIWGISVNTSVMTCGTSDPREILRRALEVADRTGKPLLFGARRAPDIDVSEQLAHLRPGDLFTYCLNPVETSLVRDGHALDCAREAHEQGILFDLGHGVTSFNFPTLEAMLADGLPPDTLSSDIYRAQMAWEPRFDLPLVMSKVRAAGMTEAEIWPRVTTRPAEVLGLSDEIGSLKTGACADLVVLRWDPGPYLHSDAAGNERSGGIYRPAVTVRAGEVIKPAC